MKSTLSPVPLKPPTVNAPVTLGDSKLSVNRVSIEDRADPFRYTADVTVPDSTFMVMEVLTTVGDSFPLGCTKSLNSPSGNLRDTRPSLSEYKFFQKFPLPLREYAYI